MMNTVSLNPPEPTIVDKLIDALNHVSDPERMRGTAQWWQEQYRDLAAKASSLDVLGAQLDGREKAIVQNEAALTAREAAIVTAEINAKSVHDSAIALLTTAEKASKAADDKSAKVAETAAALQATQRELASLINTAV